MVSVLIPLLALVPLSTCQTTTVDFTSNLRAWWKFDGNLQDFSGHGLTAVSGGSISYVTGKVGNALRLDGGSTSYVTGPPSSTVIYGDSSFTVLLWVSSTATVGRLISVYASGATLKFALDLSTTQIDMSYNVANSISTISMPANWLTGTFHQVGTTYNSVNDELRVYFDGVLKNTVTAGQIMNSGTGVIEIGTGTSGTLLDGAIDDVKMFNRTLDGYEIGRFYSGLSHMSTNVTCYDGSNIFVAGQHVRCSLRLYTDFGTNFIPASDSRCKVAACPIYDGDRSEIMEKDRVDYSGNGIFELSFVPTRAGTHGSVTVLYEGLTISTMQFTVIHGTEDTSKREVNCSLLSQGTSCTTTSYDQFKNPIRQCTQNFWETSSCTMN